MRKIGNNPLRRGVLLLGDGDYWATGFVYRTEGETAYIVTDTHRFLALGTDKIPVITQEGERILGDIFWHWNTPVAVVRVCCGEFHPLKFSDDPPLKSGDEVSGIGFVNPYWPPGEFSTTVTRVFESGSAETDRFFHQWEMGSPLFDQNGGVVGIVTQKGG